MKSSQLLRGILFLTAFTASLLTGTAAESAVVRADRVNVRGKASLQSEVITQLRKGESVSVLEEVSASGGTKNAPASAWFKIAMPANTPVWVNASHIDSTSKTVNVRRLNIRGGAGENYSVLGTLDKGAAVKEIRIVGDWMEIEAPTNTFGFVSAELINRDGSAPVAATTAGTKPTVEKLPVKEVESPAVEPVSPAPVAVVPPADPKPADPASKPVAEPSRPLPTQTPPVAAPVAVSPLPPTPVPGAAPAGAEEPLPKRTVSREGIVKKTFSIQAPGEYQLVSVDNGKTLNYLITRKLGFPLDGFTGRKVVVTGEELIDKRWLNTPIIDIETFRIVP